MFQGKNGFQSVCCMDTNILMAWDILEFPPVGNGDMYIDHHCKVMDWRMA